MFTSITWHVTRVTARTVYEYSSSLSNIRYASINNDCTSKFIQKNILSLIIALLRSQYWSQNLTTRSRWYLMAKIMLRET